MRSRATLTFVYPSLGRFYCCDTSVRYGSFVYEDPASSEDHFTFKNRYFRLNSYLDMQGRCRATYVLIVRSIKYKQPR